MTETSEIWTGEAARYEQTRPTPPPVLLDILTQLIQMPRPALVVDLGSGTGLSTRFWTERAERVIGIEPNADMRSQAIRQSEPSAAQIEYREGLAHQTGQAAHARSHPGCRLCLAAGHRAAAGAIGSLKCQIIDLMWVRHALEDERMEGSCLSVIACEKLSLRPLRQRRQARPIIKAPNG